MNQRFLFDIQNYGEYISHVEEDHIFMGHRCQKMKYTYVLSNLVQNIGIKKKCMGRVKEKQWPFLEIIQRSQKVHMFFLQNKKDGVICQRSTRCGLYF